MTKTDARILLCGLIPDGFDADRLSARGKCEVRDAIDKILELTNDTFLAPDRPETDLPRG